MAEGVSEEAREAEGVWATVPDGWGVWEPIWETWPELVIVGILPE